MEASADLVNRICRIMADLPVEPGRAKYWIEVRFFNRPFPLEYSLKFEMFFHIWNPFQKVGEKSAPHSEAVLRLREAMLAATEGKKKRTQNI